MAETGGLFVCDAEDGGVADFDSVSQPGSSTFGASSAQKAHGSYGYRGYHDGTNNANGTKAISFTGTDLYVRMYIYIPSAAALTAYWQQLPILNVYSGANEIALLGVANGGGEPQGAITHFWFSEDLGTGGGSYIAGLTKDAWHYLEVHWYKHATAGYVEYKVNGGTAAKTSAGDHNTSSFTPTSIKAGFAGGYGGTIPSGLTIYVDDIKVSLDGWIGAYSDGGGASPNTVDLLVTFT
jgi:hypothetical protein